jgi:hypothetical protein
LRTDAARRGLAISFVTAERVTSSRRFFVFLSLTLSKWHRNGNHSLCAKRYTLHLQEVAYCGFPASERPYVRCIRLIGRHHMGGATPMPSWMLKCPECSHSFIHTKIEPSIIEDARHDPFGNPAKPRLLTVFSVFDTEAEAIKSFATSSIGTTA